MEGLQTPLILVLITIGLAYWYQKRRQRMSIFKNLGIPGPEPNFFFGNLSEFKELGDVNALKGWSKKYGKVFGYFMGGNPFIVIGDADLCKQVQIKDFHSFADRPILVKGGLSGSTNTTKHLIFETGDRWKEQRAILTPTFTTGKIKKMLPLVNECIDILMSKVEKQAKKGDSFDIYDMYKGLTLDVIGRVAFGIQTNVQTNVNDPFLLSAKELLKTEGFSFVMLLSICFPELEKVLYWVRRIYGSILAKFGTNRVREFTESCKEVVKARRSDPQNRRDDLLQLMLDAEISRQDINKATISDLTAGYDSEDTKEVPIIKTDLKSAVTGDRKGKGRSVYHMTDDEILSNTIIIFFAGYETTSTALAFTTHILVNDPDLQDKMRQEIQEVLAREGKLDYNSVGQLKLMEQVFAEVLRYYPPIATFVNRKSNIETTYGDLKIPKGTAIQIPVPVLHRDPDYWTDPDVFDHERFSSENRIKINPMAYQPFGAGPRNCIGMRFAQLEAKLALANILKDYKILPCEKTEKGDVEVIYKFAIMSPKNGINIKVEKLV